MHCKNLTREGKIFKKNLIEPHLQKDQSETGILEKSWKKF